MKLETRKQLVSLGLTFLSTFLATVAVGFESVTAETLEVSVIGALIVTGLRAGLKALFLKYIADGN